MKKANRRTSAQMYPLVEQWQNSKYSKSEFCSEHEMNIHTFTYWIQKYQNDQSTDAKNTASTDSFISLAVSSPAATSTPSFVRYPNGVELHLLDLPSASTLSVLLKLGD